jgi:hypothetical protein
VNLGFLRRRAVRDVDHQESPVVRKRRVDEDARVVPNAKNEFLIARLCNGPALYARAFGPVARVK